MEAYITQLLHMCLHEYCKTMFIVFSCAKWAVRLNYLVYHHEISWKNNI